MPRFQMTDKEASLMSDYIKNVYVTDDIPRFFEYDLTPLDAGGGRRVFDSLGCINCHILNRIGGYVGPQLDQVGDRLEAGWVYKWLLDPLEYKPETIHPDYDLPDREARELTAFLMTRRSGAP
jgi:cbb3-type cytochrome oxidase cytochrome c subunit